jgi:hypothetical protein
MSGGGCWQGAANFEDDDMRFLAVPILASFAILATPGFAQNYNPSGTQHSDASTASQMPQDTAVTLDTQQKLKQSLEQGGFKDVIVVPEAFVIHAKAPDGSKIVMELSPDQMQAVIERTGSSSQPPGNTSR